MRGPELSLSIFVQWFVPSRTCGERPRATAVGGRGGRGGSDRRDLGIHPSQRRQSIAFARTRSRLCPTPTTLSDSRTLLSGLPTLSDSPTLRLPDSSTPRLFYPTPRLFSPTPRLFSQTPRLLDSATSSTASAARPLAPGPPSFARTSLSPRRVSSARCGFVRSVNVSAAMLSAVQFS